MKKDYLCVCNCGFEVYTKTLKEAKAQTRAHLKGYNHTHEVYIDRCIDNEIDDNYKYIVMKGKANI